jgi:hypothetical protein
MRRSTGCVAAAATVLTFAAYGGGASQLEPGDRLGSMLFARGTAAGADA